MGARPSTFTRGGGHLNNVNWTIKGYVWTDAFPNKDGELAAFEPGKMKSYDGKWLIDKPHNLNLVFTIRVDDAKEDQYLPLKAASNYDNFAVSEDGLTVTSAEGGKCSINQNTAGAKLIASFVKAGVDAGTFSEDQLSDDEDSINFEPLIGYRVRSIRQVDVERTKKFGGRVLKAQNGKAARTVERDDLLIDEVYAFEEVVQPAKPAAKPATAKPATAKAAPATKAAAKPATKAKVTTPAVDVAALSETTLKDILRANGGTIEKQKLGMKILLKLTKDPSREDVRTYLFDDTNLASIPNVGYDQESGVIALDE